MKIIRLTSRQFDQMETSTRRSLMEQLMIIDAGIYRYSLGAQGQYWTLLRYDRNECIGEDEWEEGYEPLLIDKWI